MNNINPVPVSHPYRTNKRLVQPESLPTSKGLAVQYHEQEPNTKDAKSLLIFFVSFVLFVLPPPKA